MQTDAQRIALIIEDDPTFGEVMLSAVHQLFAGWQAAMVDLGLSDVSCDLHRADPHPQPLPQARRALAGAGRDEGAGSRLDLSTELSAARDQEPRWR